MMNKRNEKVLLTVPVVKAHTCPQAQSQAILWDTEVKGLGVRALPSHTKDGLTIPGAKTYVFQGRVANTCIERRITIGRTDALPLKGDDTHADESRHGARQRARKLRNMMDMGRDPIAERVQAQEQAVLNTARSKVSAVTLRQVADHYISNKKTRNGPLKANTIRDINAHVDKSFATWAPHPIASITRDMCEARHKELATRGLTGKRAAPHRARGAFIVLRALINWAMEKYRIDGRRLLDENPVSVLRGQMAPPNASDKRVATPRIGHVWEALMQARAEATTTTARTQADALAFMLLTGGRSTEVRDLTWDRVQLDEGGGSWYLPTPKNGNPVTFPLSKAARELLAERPRRKDCNFVFPGRNGKKPIGPPRGAAMRDVIAAAGSPQTRHSLRATFTTLGLTELRFEKWRTDLLTNHKLTGDVTLNNYTEKSNLRYLSPEADQVGAWITAQADIAASRNVVPLVPKRRTRSG